MKNKMMKKKVRKEEIRYIEIPNDSTVTLSEDKKTLTVNKKNVELKRKAEKEVNVSIEGNKIILSCVNARKNEKRKLGTFEGHIKNIFAGLEKQFEYDLEICNVHFPMTVTFDKAKSEFIIKNLLGEKYPRIVKVGKNIEVEIKAPHIKIKSPDIETAGQAASLLERGALVRNRDRNKFQDGIFITKKPGKEYI